MIERNDGAVAHGDIDETQDVVSGGRHDGDAHAAR